MLLAVVLSLSIIFVFSYDIPFVKNIYNPNAYRIIPEYKRTLKKIVISLGTKETSLDLHSDLLRQLPNYTEIIILLPKNNLNVISERLTDQPFAHRTRLVGFDTNLREGLHAYLVFPEKDKLIDFGPLKGDTILRGSLWTQDLFEVATRADGQTVLLISDLHKWFISHTGDDSLNVISDNSFLERLSTMDMEVRRLPVTFKGGNILVDEIGNKRIVLCGGDVFRLTRTVWKSTRESMPSDGQIINMIKQFLNADEVVVVGREKVQPNIMFHLDQAVVFLSNGVAGITHVVGKDNIPVNDAIKIKEVELFLLELRSILSQLGYKIVNINTSANGILSYQYYVNGIPYVDATTGQKTFLMPVFSSFQTTLENELVEKNTDIFESLGYRVVHVQTEANRIHGGLHCMVNVVE